MFFHLGREKPVVSVISCLFVGDYKELYSPEEPKSKSISSLTFPVY